MQRRVDVLRVCQVPILQGVAATPITLRDAEVEDQAPAASLVSQEVANLHVAAPLARASRDSESSKMNNSDACVSMRHPPLRIFRNKQEPWRKKSFLGKKYNCEKILRKKISHML